MDAARFQQICVPPAAVVRSAIEAIDAGGVEIALVVDSDRRLLGTISDGDVRRALLRGVQLEDSIDGLVHTDPIVAPIGTEPEALLDVMVRAAVEQIPLVDDGRVVDLVFIRDLLEKGDHEHPVVLMAGGEGARLRPLTDDVPKPMLPVGGRPLLERIVGQVREAGFSKVLMAVNYRAETIEEHFGDGAEFGVEIRYVHEPERLGSAGALRLAREELDRPFIVMNADLLTRVNLSALLRFHHEEQNLLTVGIRKYVLEVPYGIVELDGTRVKDVREKPTLEHFVNAGVYAVDPGAVALMPAERAEFNMTELIDAALAVGRRVGAFPVREYWLDIGHMADYERAQAEHATYLSAPR